MKELEVFVRIILDAGQRRPELFAAIQEQGREKQGKFIPMLFLGTSTGDFLDVIPYKTKKKEVVTKVNSSLKKFRSVKMIQRLISEAEEFLAQEDYLEATSKAQKVKDVKNADGKLLAMADVILEKITQETEKELVEAEKFIEVEDYLSADRALVRVQKTYRGLPVEIKASELLKDMRSNPKIAGIINALNKEDIIFISEKPTLPFV